MTTTPEHASPAQATTLPRRRPGTHRPAAPRPAGLPGYDLDRAWQLLADTRDLPATERGMLKILTQYRRALHDLATQLQAIQRPQQPAGHPGPQPGPRLTAPSPEEGQAAAVTRPPADSSRRAATTP